MSLANDAQTNLVLSQMSGLQRKQLDRDGDGKFSASELAAGGFRGFNMSKTGPARDHASGDANTMKYLAAEAQKKQAYRSDEQKLTDHHQATGFTSAGPVAFGQYEVGRSSMPAHCHATRIFLDQTKRGEVYPHPDGHQKLEQGDPGHYTPYDIEGENAIEMKDVTRFTHNKQAKFAFGSLSERDIGQVRGLVPGIDAPGPGQYDAGRGKNYVYRTINPVNSAFNSKSLQRAESRTTVPGPGAYDAKFESIEAYQRDGGASMRSQVRRAEAHEMSGHPSQIGGHTSCTPKEVGPGHYEVKQFCLNDNLDGLLKRQSKLKPGFGTIEPQRKLPFEYNTNHPQGPGPGDYEPTVWTGPPPGSRSASRKGSRKTSDGR